MLLLSIFLSLAPANANTYQIEAVYARRLAAAAHSGEVERLRADFEALRVSLLACQLQIAQGDVPVACYQRRRHLRTWLPKETVPDSANDLDRRCRQATRALRVPGEAINLNDLSSDCRGRVVEARRILRYRGEPARTWSED